MILLFNAEHATTIDGEGKNPTLENILPLAKNIGLKEKQVCETVLVIIEESFVIKYHYGHKRTDKRESI